MTGDAEAFLEWVLPRMRSADLALHNGDPTARIAMWSRNDPVTVFGNAVSAKGWNDIGPLFEALATRFSGCTSYEVEVVAADAGADLGYVVAIERTTASIAGREPAAFALRVTTVFRREGAEWKVAHRHADAYDEGAREGAAHLRESGLR